MRDFQLNIANLKSVLARIGSQCRLWRSCRALCCRRPMPQTIRAARFWMHWSLSSFINMRHCWKQFRLLRHVTTALTVHLYVCASSVTLVHMLKPLDWIRCHLSELMWSKVTLYETVPGLHRNRRLGIGTPVCTDVS